MFTALFEVIIVIVMIRAFRDSKKNKQRKQISSPKPPVPNKPASGNQETGWTPTPKKPKTVVPNQPNPEKKKPDKAACSFTEPAKRYQPPAHSGERYEEWMPVPEGKKVCRCGYCAADNLIPKSANPKDYSCYFCREEL